MTAERPSAIPLCTAEASLCGGTPADCWNHSSTDGRCYRLSEIEQMIKSLDPKPSWEDR